jgi:hypothetical protein
VHRRRKRPVRREERARISLGLVALRPIHAATVIRRRRCVKCRASCHEARRRPGHPQQRGRGGRPAGPMISGGHPRQSRPRGGQQPGAASVAGGTRGGQQPGPASVAGGTRGGQRRATSRSTAR